MIQRAKKHRSRASLQVEATLMSSIWVLNLYQIAFHIRSMDLLAGLTAGMIFLIAPLEVARAVSGYREDHR